MLRVSSRRLHIGARIVASLLFASCAASGQSTSSQPVSTQSLSGPSLSQSSPSQSASSQSLGEIARKNQEKKSAAGSSTTAPKVITNADLPKDPDGYTGPPASPDQSASPSPENAAESRRTAQQRAAQQRAAEQWRQQILAQKNRVAILQQRVARLRARIHFVDPGNPYASDPSYWAGLAYNAQETRLMERLHDMEVQLSQQKHKLEDMQEAARHAGMHTNVYDP